jgi:hypothetical protein
MKLSVKSLTISIAIVWGFCFFFVAICNYFWPPYGKAFLEVVSSVYPGYRAAGTAGSVIIGTLYALLDGTIGGAIFALLYNYLAE